MSYKILIVEDDAITLDFLLNRLKTEGHIALGASNGSRAREILTTNSPDLVLLDLTLPDDTGLDILDLIRSEPHIAKVPVIVFTGNANLEMADKARQHGANGYLVKPCPPEAISKRIEQVMDNRFKQAS